MLQILYFRWQDRPSAEQPIQHLQRQLQVASKVLLCNSQFSSLLWLAQHLVKRPCWAHNTSQICRQVRLCRFHRFQSFHSSRSVYVRGKNRLVEFLSQESFWFAGNIGQVKPRAPVVTLTTREAARLPAPSVSQARPSASATTTPASQQHTTQSTLASQARPLPRVILTSDSNFLEYIYIFKIFSFQCLMCSYILIGLYH